MQGGWKQKILGKLWTKSPMPMLAGLSYAMVKEVVVKKLILCLCALADGCKAVADGLVGQVLAGPIFSG